MTFIEARAVLVMEPQLDHLVLLEVLKLVLVKGENDALGNMLLLPNHKLELCFEEGLFLEALDEYLSFVELSHCVCILLSRAVGHW